MHKITSNLYDLRKILTKNFWSQGTLLGSPGPGSQADVGLGFCRFQFLVIWGPHEGPAPLVSQGTPKNLKVTGAWCAFDKYGTMPPSPSMSLFIDSYFKLLLL